MMDSCGTQVAVAPLGSERPWAPHRRDSEPLKPSDEGTFSCLSEVDLFADLTKDEILAFDRMAPAKSFGAGELVFSQSQPVTALFILKKGRVRIFRVTEEGKALTMAILEPGAVFGEMMMVGQRMYDNYAEALDSVDLCLLNAKDVEQYLLSDPRIGYHTGAAGIEDAAKAEGLEMLDLVFFTPEQLATMKNGELNEAQDRVVAIMTAMKAAAGA